MAKSQKKQSRNRRQGKWLIRHGWRGYRRCVDIRRRVIRRSKNASRLLSRVVLQRWTSDNIEQTFKNVYLQMILQVVTMWLMQKNIMSKAGKHSRNRGQRKRSFHHGRGDRGGVSAWRDHARVRLPDGRRRWRRLLLEHAEKALPENIASYFFGLVIFWFICDYLDYCTS